MQPVKIHIYSQSHSSAGTENIETTAYGRLAEKNNKYYVFYDESEAAGLAGTKTTIKWDYERVIILRSGTVGCRQEFAGGLVSESMYRTPYLALPMPADDRVFICLLPRQSLAYRFGICFRTGRTDTQQI